MNNELHWIWADWVISKRLFAPPCAKNILLSLLQLPTRPMPDADMLLNMVHYNSAVNSLPPEDIAVWLVKTFNLKVYRSRKDAIYRMGFNNAASFYRKSESVHKEINKRYNQICMNIEAAKRRESGVDISYRRVEEFTL